MGLAGAGYGASLALEDIVARRIERQKLEQEIARVQAQEQLQRDSLAQRQTEEGNRVRERQRDDDRLDADRRDRSNARGLDLMERDRQTMDMDAAIAGLPAHLKPLGPLMKAGGVGKISAEDVEDPNVRAARAAKLREQNVQDQIRIRNSTRDPKITEQIFVRRGDQVIPIPKGTAQSGDIPYDQVAARSSKPEDQKEAVDTANEAARLASALRNHKGLNGAFGAWGARIPTFNQTTADAEVLLNSLTSLLTMENMGKMKGVLSDSDMRVLKQASSTLSPSMSESAARAELDRIVEVMGRVAAGQTPAASGGTATSPEAAAMALIERARAGRKPGG